MASSRRAPRSGRKPGGDQALVLASRGGRQVRLLVLPPSIEQLADRDARAPSASGVSLGHQAGELAIRVTLRAAEGDAALAATTRYEVGREGDTKLPATRPDLAHAATHRAGPYTHRWDFGGILVWPSEALDS